MVVALTKIMLLEVLKLLSKKKKKFSSFIYNVEKDYKNIMKPKTVGYNLTSQNNKKWALRKFRRTLKIFKILKYNWKK